ncbi:MAG: hypothetical protein ACYC5A_00985 [Thermoleophilia bacterium]
MTIAEDKRTVLILLIAAAALALSLLTVASLDRAPAARAAEGGITVGLNKLVFAPGETIELSVALDSGGQALAGELLLRVYPPASPAAPDPFAPAPISEKRLAEGVNVAGTAATTAAVPLGEIGVGTGGYPARVLLVSGGQEVLAGDVWIAVVDPAAAPMDLVLLWTVGGPPQRNAENHFTSLALAERCRNEPRTQDSILQHETITRGYPAIKTTYAIQPAMLDELLDLADGFELDEGGGARQLDAASLEAVQAISCLESLRQLPTYDNVEIIGTPYTFADLTLLARQGWADGTGQYRLGHDVLTETLLLADVPDGAYVPGLNLTTDSLRYVAATGGDYAVLAGSIKSSVQARDPAAVTHRLRDLSGERLTGLFADDGASGALLGSNPDPDAFFAALANAQAAGTPLVIAAATTPSPALAADMRGQVYAELARQPWVRSITLGEAEDKYRPDSEPATLLRYVDTATGYITRAYYDRMEKVHEKYEDFRAAVDAEEPQMVRLTKLMFTAENSYWFNEDPDPESANSGLAVLDEIERMVATEVAGLEVDVDTPLVQGSGTGTALVTIINNNLYAFTVELSLSADQDVVFPDGAIRELRVESGVTQVEIPYVSSGWSGIDARLMSRGHILVDDSSGIRPLTLRFWLVALLIAALAAGGIGYYYSVAKRG